MNTGDKATINMPDGLRWPAIAISDETTVVQNVFNQRTKANIEIPVTRVYFISLRETKPDAETGEVRKYLRVSTEVTQFGYSPKAEPRFNTIVGLDATADGEKIHLQDLLDEHGKAFAAWQAGNFAARNTATDADTL